MDKLSEHAIRMLEIADTPYRNEYGTINKDLQDKHDIARAVYDTILQVQMLKMADRKTEPNCSENPNNCEPQTCRNCKWSQTVCRLGDSPPCHSYEPKTEPQTDWKDQMWTEAIEAEKTEPQTEDEILREQCRAFMGIVEQTERSEK